MDDERLNGRIDEAVLALLYLGIFESHPVGSARDRKSFDWDAMGRLHEKGLISDPTGKANRWFWPRRDCARPKRPSFVCSRPMTESLRAAGFGQKVPWRRRPDTGYPRS